MNSCWPMFTLTFSAMPSIFIAVRQVRLPSGWIRCHVVQVPSSYAHSASAHSEYNPHVLLCASNETNLHCLIDEHNCLQYAKGSLKRAPFGTGITVAFGSQQPVVSKLKGSYWEVSTNRNAVLAEGCSQRCTKIFLSSLSLCALLTMHIVSASVAGASVSTPTRASSWPSGVNLSGTYCAG